MTVNLSLWWRSCALSMFYLKDFRSDVRNHYTRNEWSITDEMKWWSLSQSNADELIMMYVFLSEYRQDVQGDLCCVCLVFPSWLSSYRIGWRCKLVGDQVFASDFDTSWVLLLTHSSFVYFSFKSRICCLTCALCRLVVLRKDIRQSYILIVAE